MAELVRAAAADLLSGLCEEDRAGLAAVREEELQWDPWVRDPGHRALFRRFKAFPGLEEDCRTLAGGLRIRGVTAVVVKAAWNHLHGLEPGHHQRIVPGFLNCGVCGLTFRAHLWHEGDPAFPQSKCHACRDMGSYEFQVRLSQNLHAVRSFLRARRLGIDIHWRYRFACRRGSRWIWSEDGRLLSVVRDAYDGDRKFRRLWIQVKGAPPGDQHLPWLRLWKRL